MTDVPSIELRAISQSRKIDDINLSRQETESLHTPGLWTMTRLSMAYVYAVADGSVTSLGCGFHDDYPLMTEVAI